MRRIVIQLGLCSIGRFAGLTFWPIYRQPLIMLKRHHNDNHPKRRAF